MPTTTIHREVTPQQAAAALQAQLGSGSAGDRRIAPGHLHVRMAERRL